MTIKAWPSSERPREKLLSFGAHSLSDAELIAILFGKGTRGKSAVELAHDMLNELGTLRGCYCIRGALYVAKRHWALPLCAVSCSL
jgi:DNA repair protein RadC